MKKLLTLLVSLTISLAVLAQKAQVDTIALMVLNQMADVIGDMNSCSFKVASSTDVQDFDFGTFQQNGLHEVVLAGPNKMLVLTNGDKGHQGYWYNGEELVYYSFSENNYALLETSTNIVSTIETINKNYGIDFPAADFFYPTFIDDLLDEFPSIRFVGMSKVGEQQCFSITASNSQKSIQFWIANDAYSLPRKFVITYKNHENKQYSATFSNWIINHDIPAAVFEFYPPPMASQIIMQPITKK